MMSGLAQVGEAVSRGPDVMECGVERGASGWEGVEVLWSPWVRGDVEAVVLAFDAGAEQDPEGMAGVAGLTTALLRGRLLRHVSQEMGGGWGDLTVRLEWDCVKVRMTGWSEELRHGVREVGRAVGSFVAREEEVAAIREKYLAMLARGGGHALVRAQYMLPECVFEEGSLYGRPVDGLSESIRSLGVEEIRRFYEEKFLRSYLGICYAGRGWKSAVEAMADAGVLEGRTRTAAGTRGVEYQPGEGVRKVRDVNGGPGAVLVGTKGPSRGSLGFDVGEVLDAMVAGGGTSRVSRRLREEERLAYSVVSGLVGMRWAGMFWVGAVCGSDDNGRVIDIMQEEMEGFATGGAREQDVEVAKKLCQGKFVVRGQSAIGMAELVSRIAVYELPLGYWSMVQRRWMEMDVGGIEALIHREMDVSSLKWVIVEGG